MDKPTRKITELLDLLSKYTYIATEKETLLVDNGVLLEQSSRFRMLKEQIKELTDELTLLCEELDVSESYRFASNIRRIIKTHV